MYYTTIVNDIRRRYNLIIFLNHRLTNFERWKTSKPIKRVDDTRIIETMVTRPPKGLIIHIVLS